MASHPSTIVIGAGFQGLMAAHVLRRQGLPVIVLEAEDRVGVPWRRRHPQLRLNTHRLSSPLPGLAFPAEAGPYPDRAAVVAQIEAYAARLDAPIRFGVRVERIDRIENDWLVRSSASAFRAEHVIVATGRARFPRMPDWPGRASFAGELRHSEAFGDAKDYAGKSVLVVGAGNSAVDLIGHLAEIPTGPLRLAVRTGAGILPKRLLGFPAQLSAPLLAPLPLRITDAFIGATARLAFGDLTRHGLPRPPEGAASRMARDGTAVAIDDGFVRMLKAGRVEVVPQVVRFDGPDVVLGDGRRIRPDIVVAATGYATGLEPMVGHLDVLGPDGVPRQATEIRRTAPGLWFIGMRPSLVGFFAAGCKEARRIAKSIAGSARPAKAPVAAPERRRAA